MRRISTSRTSAPARSAAITQPDGRVDSLPVETDLWLVYYNKQLLPQMPKTMDEMMAVAHKLTDPSKNQYGFVGRGLKNANVPVWTSFLLGQGQETMTPDGKTLLTDTPEAIWAGEYYKKIMRECAPPGVVGFNWNECQTSFMQGNVAHVAGRRRLLPAAGRPEGVEDLRPCRRRADAGRAEGAPLRHVQRRHRHRREEQGRRTRPGCIASGPPASRCA